MRDRPVRFSDNTGCLCGHAEEPFAPEKNYSRQPLRCADKCRISVARRSTDDAITPSVRQK